MCVIVILLSAALGCTVLRVSGGKKPRSRRCGGKTWGEQEDEKLVYSEETKISLEGATARLLQLLYLCLLFVCEECTIGILRKE